MRKFSLKGKDNCHNHQFAMYNSSLGQKNGVFMSCLFCKIIQKEIPATVLYEDNDIMAFNDIKPQAPTHALIIPKRHIATINETNENDAALLGHMIVQAKQLAHTLNIRETGYRLVFNINSGGGQEVFHIHLHVLGGRQMTWPPG